MKKGKKGIDNCNVGLNKDEKQSMGGMNRKIWKGGKRERESEQFQEYMQKKNLH